MKLEKFWMKCLVCEKGVNNLKHTFRTIGVNKIWFEWT